MGTNILSLPVDIPWKRLAISQDMYASSLDAPLPAKWESSLAVFFYEPEPDPLVDIDEVSTFLKVVASITGYNVEDTYVPAFTGGKIKGGFYIPGQYYPALSAVVQVAVFPKVVAAPAPSAGWLRYARELLWVNSYPYFTDFQPKMREIIETQTDTGEFLSSTSGQGGVTKSTVNAIDAKLPIRPIDPTIDTTSTVTPSEDRHTYSYTTTISQLYEVLNSYHIGTNRALFLVNARPHLQDSIYTFVNGPRQLEGIQEFLLVVRRPKDMKGLCVKARLETAHLDLGDTSDDLATLFITAREVSGCYDPKGIVINLCEPWTEYEKLLAQSVKDLLKNASQAGKDAAAAANAVNRQVSEEMINSIGSSNRYGPGEIDFMHTNLAMRKIMARIPTAALEGQPKLLSAINNIRPSLTIGPAKRLALGEIKARSQFLDLLGVKTPGQSGTKENGKNKKRNGKK